ncbi:MAG: hypothetical protein MUE41_17650 [Gemmatimonadaceae bacterium]|nr:hypothetical protein [Gemmatimonadaceae bacterium]
MVLAQPDWSRAAGTVRATRCELVARLSGTGRERALATGFAGLSRWFMARAQQRNWNPDLSIDWRRIRAPPRARRPSTGAALGTR